MIPPRILGRYGAALSFLAGALLLRWAMDPLLGGRLPLATVYAAIVFAVLWSGTGPAIVVAVMGYVFADMLFISPRGVLGTTNTDLIVFAMHATTTGVILFLGHRLQAERLLRTGAQRERAVLESRARIALEAARMGSFSWFPPDTVIADARCREIGRLPARGDLALADVNRHIHAEDLPAVQAARKRALDPAGDGTFAQEYRFVHDDGSIRVVASRGQVEFEDRDGVRVPVAMHGAIMDITPLREAEVAQRLLVAVHDVARGASDPQEVLRRVADLAAGHFAAPCAYREAHGAQGAALDVDAATLEALRAGRTVVQPRLLAVPLVKQGRLTAAISLRPAAARAWSDGDVALLEQLAERTWSVLETARAQQALRESRDVLALAMQGSRMGAWSRDFATNRVWWSPELEALFGLPPGGFDGRYENFIARLHEDDRPKLRAAVEEALAGGHDYIIEFRFRHASGEWRWMEGRGKAVYADGTPVMSYGLGMDITERKAGEAALREADRRKDEFLATLAHELRNPLAPIRNAVELLRLQYAQDEGVQRLRGLIDRQLRQLTRLVDDLLELSRITRGVIPLRRREFDLAAAVGEAVEAVRPQLQEARHALEIRVPEAPVVVDADEARITQVVQNLLHNAVRYTPPGGHIAVEVAREDGQARITVRDDGIGIAEDQKARVFEMFARGIGALEHNREGLGIGLSLVKGIVTMHGGRVAVASEGPGRGSAFTVWLPQ